ncbi:hypothetical protein J3R74_003809 [Puniceicoccus vermicola]
MKQVLIAVQAGGERNLASRRDSAFPSLCSDLGTLTVAQLKLSDYLVKSTFDVVVIWAESGALARLRLSRRE